MHYAFDLKQLCGGYAYYSVFTHGGKSGDNRYDERTPSQIDRTLFGNALKDLGLRGTFVDSASSYRNWQLMHGWAIVELTFARMHMAQWLKTHDCVRSALGSYTDVAIAAPSVLKRSLRGRPRDTILTRDNNKCLLCDAQENLTLQHILPYSLGGETHSTNLTALCEPCNQKLRDEFHNELYELAGLHSGADFSLLKASDFSDLAFARAQQFSSNLMHSRCEVW